MPQRRLAYGHSSRVTGRDRSVFFRCMATLFDSGVRLDSAFDLLAQQSECQAIAEAARGVAHKLSSGHALSRSMQAYPGCFTSFHIRMMQVGERSGSLGMMFGRLAEHEEQRDKTLQKIRGSLLLPILITLGCLLLVGVLLPLLLSSVLELMAENAQKLPAPTRLLMGVAGLLRSPLFYVTFPFVVVGAVWGGRRWLANPQVRLQIHQHMLTVPGLGKVLRLAAVAQFSRSLELMTTVGLPLLPSLELAGTSSGNPVLESAVLQASQNVRDGMELAPALAGSTFFPEAYLTTLKAGTESGSLSEMLCFLAKLYELELETSLDTFTRLLEPLVLVLVGAMVGFCVIATLLPMAAVLESL